MEKKLFELFDIPPKIISKEILKHECGENGCSIHTELEVTEEYPTLSIEQCKHLLDIIINEYNLRHIGGETYNDAKAYLKEIRNDMQ